MVDYTVVAYTTERYYSRIDKLEKSLNDLNIKHYLIKLKGWGTRREHGLHRPTFVLSAIEKLKSTILYVDADALFIKKPEIPDIEFDVGITKKIDENGVFINRQNLENWNFASLFNYTEPSLMFIKQWKWYCDRRKIEPKASDHHRLNWTRKELNGKYKEIYTNKFFSGCIIGYINGGKTAVEIGIESNDQN